MWCRQVRSNILQYALYLLTWLIKFMQVEGHVKCMCTNFGGRGLLNYRDFAPPSNLPSDHGL